MILFIIFWVPVCLLLYQLMLYAAPFLEQISTVKWCALILLGLLGPQAGKLKDAYLTPRAARYFALFQLIDEQTRLYLGRIIDREERKLSTRFLAGDSTRRRRALDRLFEEHNIEIAREQAKRLAQPEAALNIFKVRHSAVKFKYLLHHLGYSECLRSLLAIAVRPKAILPSWPTDQGDRRGAGKSVTSTTTGIVLGRRKYEQPHVQAYVLGVASPKLKRKYQVFVSSTYLDLKEERQHVLRALLGTECIPAGMEFFPSSDEELWSLIRNVVDECDYYVLLIGNRYGSTTREGVSYTEAEYDYALETGKPILAFLRASPAPPSNEAPDKQARLSSFVERIRSSHAPGYWSKPEELPFLVHQAIEKLKRQRAGVGWTRPETR